MKTETPTPEQMEFARKWCELKGKRPEYIPPKWGNEERFLWLAWSCRDSISEDDYCRLPDMLLAEAGRCHISHNAAMSALALALAELCAIVGVPEIVAEAKREERERCALLCEEEFRQRFHRAETTEKPHSIEQRIQHNKAITASGLADAIRKGASS